MLALIPVVVPVQTKDGQPMKRGSWWWTWGWWAMYRTFFLPSIHASLSFPSYLNQIDQTLLATLAFDHWSALLSVRMYGEDGGFGVTVLCTSWLSSSSSINFLRRLSLLYLLFRRAFPFSPYTQHLVLLWNLKGRTRKKKESRKRRLISMGTWVLMLHHHIININISSLSLSSLPLDRQTDTMRERRPSLEGRRGVEDKEEEAEFLDSDEQANLIAELRRKGIHQSLSTRVSVRSCWIPPCIWLDVCACLDVSHPLQRTETLSSVIHCLTASSILLHIHGINDAFPPRTPEPL